MPIQHSFCSILSLAGLILIAGCSSHEQPEQAKLRDRTTIETQKNNSQPATLNLNTEKKEQQKEIILASGNEELKDTTLDQEQPAEFSPLASDVKVDEAMMNEIEQIRKSVGISVLPPEEMANDDDENLFTTALRKVAEGVIKPANNSNVVIDGNAIADLPVNDQTPQRLTSTNNFTEKSDQKRLITGLQNAIVDLETNAKEAESKQDYALADHMRQSAQAIRVVIRDLNARSK